MMREENSVLVVRMETDSKEAEVEEVPEVASEVTKKVEEVASEVTEAVSEETIVEASEAMIVVAQEVADLMKVPQGVEAKTFSPRQISLHCSNERT